MESSKQNFLLIFIMSLFMGLMTGCGEKNNIKQGAKLPVITVGDVIVVGEKMVNIYEKPDRVSNIIDIQETGNRLTVTDVKPGWVMVKPEKNGLLRNQEGEFTGWVNTQEIMNTTGSSQDQGNIASSGKRPRKSDQPPVSGKTGTGQKFSRQETTQLCGKMSNVVKEKKHSPKRKQKKESPYAYLKPLKIRVLGVKQVAYDDFMKEISTKFKRIDKRFLAGFDKGKKIVIVELSIKNPNKKTYPSSPTNWQLRETSSSKNLFPNRCPFRYFRGCKFRFPGGLIRPNRTENGGVSFIVPGELQISKSLLIYRPEGTKLIKEFSLQRK